MLNRNDLKMVKEVETHLIFQVGCLLSEASKIKVGYYTKLQIPRFLFLFPYETNYIEGDRIKA